MGKWKEASKKITACLLAVTVVFSAGCGAESADSGEYEKKSALLEEAVLQEEVKEKIGEAPAGEAGNAVFLSVCDTTKRADVFTGTGETLEEAWEDADRKAAEAVQKSGMEPVWMKADVVNASEQMSMQTFAKGLSEYKESFFRFGVAFDEKFENALLEAELNGAKILDYEGGTGILQEELNQYLRKADRPEVEYRLKSCRPFTCMGWLCDETDTVLPLSAEGLDYGRRSVTNLDRDYAKQLILDSSDYLVDQLKEDGSFVYGYKPRFDNEIEGYNILRHEGTIWALLLRYRIDPQPEVKEAIEQALAFLETQVVYKDENTAYLNEATSGEIKLGGCGIAIVTLTEYMDVFQSDQYTELCTKLGNGILAMMDSETGAYFHVLNSDFTEKEEFRTVYYDGEATFALSRLYSVTKDEKWLDAACKAMDHFIENDYISYHDHWISYAVNELTKYVKDNPAYYEFGLKNAQANFDFMVNIKTSYPTLFELLMAAFDLYTRMEENNISVEGFHKDVFFDVMNDRLDKMLNGYFYPEYAMYMKNPARISHAFMTRHDGYRTRIDDTQHNIGGLYQYWKLYDKLTANGFQPE